MKATLLMKIMVCLLPMVIVWPVFTLSSENSPGHAVILQYHHFGEDTPPSTSVPLETFRQHLSYIERNGYTVWPVEKIVTHLKEGKEVPEKCVGITIDDAYESVYERAYPLLKKHGFPFTVFVPTEAAEKKYGISMTWEQMKEMTNHGATLSSHGHTHDYLVRRKKGETESEWKARVKQDIQKSLELLKKRLGSESGLFAYPYGEYNSALKQIVKDMNLIAFGQHSGAVWPGSDFAALPRFPMSAQYAEMNSFRTKIRSLPLPVISAEPSGPVLEEDNRKPVLKLELAPGDYSKGTMTCYASGQGRIEARWVGSEKKVLEVVADGPLPTGRSRYNCTARHKSENRYFWYSHPWLVH